MGQGSPFGVDLSGLDAKLEGQEEQSEGSESAPSTGNGDLAPDVTSSSQDTVESKSLEKPKEPDIIDLDKLDRFRFKGKEWGPKDRDNAFLMREDYTRKTQELSEARKYADNFQYDLQSVIDNPSLLNKFKAVYPKAYSDQAERILHMVQGQRNQEPSQQTPSGNSPHSEQRLDPQILRDLQELKSWRQDQEKRGYEAEVASKEAWLNSEFSKLEKKYPHALTEVVQARAQALIEHEQRVDEKVLAKLFEQSHKEIEERFKAHYKAKVTEQQKAGARAKDMAPGGGTPSPAPKTAKTLKQATAQWLADVKA